MLIQRQPRDKFQSWKQHAENSILRINPTASL